MKPAAHNHAARNSDSTGSILLCSARKWSLPLQEPWLALNTPSGRSGVCTKPGQIATLLQRGRSRQMAWPERTWPGRPAPLRRSECSGARAFGVRAKSTGWWRSCHSSPPGWKPPKRAPWKPVNQELHEHWSGFPCPPPWCAYITNANASLC